MEIVVINSDDEKVADKRVLNNFTADSVTLDRKHDAVIIRANQIKSSKELQDEFNNASQL